MTTKKDLQGLTVAQIKSGYPNGAYKSSMRKDDVIAAALKTVKEPKIGYSTGKTKEPPRG